MLKNSIFYIFLFFFCTASFDVIAGESKKNSCTHKPNSLEKKPRLKGVVNEEFNHLISQSGKACVGACAQQLLRQQSIKKS
jgi:hypothetical protein